MKPNAKVTRYRIRIAGREGGEEPRSTRLERRGGRRGGAPMRAASWRLGGGCSEQGEGYGQHAYGEWVRICIYVIYEGRVKGEGGPQRYLTPKRGGAAQHGLQHVRQRVGRRRDEGGVENASNSEVIPPAAAQAKPRMGQGGGGGTWLLGRMRRMKDHAPSWRRPRAGRGGTLS